MDSPMTPVGAQDVLETASTLLEQLRRAHAAIVSPTPDGRLGFQTMGYARYPDWERANPRAAEGLSLVARITTALELPEGVILSAAMGNLGRQDEGS